MTQTLGTDIGGTPVAIKTWWRQDYVVGEIYPADWNRVKVEKILKGSLDSIPSPSVKNQIIGRKVCFRCKGKTLLGIVNKLMKTKSLLISPRIICPITSS